MCVHKGVVCGQDVAWTTCTAVVAFTQIRQLHVNKQYDTKLSIHPYTISHMIRQAGWFQKHIVLEGDSEKWWLWNLTGWWYTYPSEKYEFVSWDHYSQYMEKMLQTTNQVLIIWSDLIVTVPTNGPAWLRHVCPDLRPDLRPLVANPSWNLGAKGRKAKSEAHIYPFTMQPMHP